MPGWTPVFAQASDSGAKPVMRQAWLASFARWARDNQLGLFGLVVVGGIVLCGLFGGRLAPYDPFKIQIADRMMPPSLEHFFGTDKLGRDVLSRVLVGSTAPLR